LTGFQDDYFNPFDKSKVIKKYLEQQGFKVYTSCYANGEPMTKSLKVYIKEVAKEIERIKPSVIIAHSMGGLIIRYLIEQMGYKIEKLIMLETPNQGIPSWPIRIGILPDCQSVRDMMKGSEFMLQLNKDWQAKRRQTAISYFQIGGIYSTIFPRIFGLQGIPIKVFKTITHSGLRSNKRSITEIIKILKS
jgi:triacylglycerol esterase/lipase EstA (alpha/beta hydrolase family)